MMNQTIVLTRTENFDLRITILKYWEVFKVNYLTSSVYLINLLAQSVTVVFRIWIYTQLYTVTFRVANSVQIGGLTTATAVWSLALVQSFQTATRPPVATLVEEEVKSGSLAYSINRPLSYILFHYFGYLGRVIPKLITNVVIGVFATMILVGFVEFTWFGLLAGLILLFLGYTLDFFMLFIIGLLSFWVEDTSAYRWIYSKGFLVFGGAIVPLALFPDAIKNIVEILPFAQLYYGAARIIVNFDFSLFQKFLFFQVIWIILFTVIAILLFRKGVKNVSINGG